MSKFKPHKDRKGTHCPWCGVEENTRKYSNYQNSKYRFYRYWGCGSQKTGKEPWQSRDCEINVLEKRVQELEERNENQSTALGRQGLKTVKLEAQVDELEKELEEVQHTHVRRI